MGSNDRVMPVHIVAAAGVITNNEGKLLLVKHNRAGRTYPGGQAEEGENLIEAAKREILEETGIEAEIGELFCVSSNTRKNSGYNGIKEIPTKVIFDFTGKAVGGTARPSAENSETDRFTADEARKMITAPFYIERFKAYIEYNGRPTYLSYVTEPEFILDLKTTL